MMMHACNVNMLVVAECGSATGKETEHKIDCEVGLPWCIFTFLCTLQI